MSPRMIRGWCTGVQLWPGRAGIRIREFGMEALTSRSELVLELASSAALDGAGAIGDLTGITTMRFTTTAGTTPIAARFITGTTSTAAEAIVAEEAIGAAVSTGPAEAPGLSMETTRPLEDTRNRAARAAPAQAPSADTTAAERQEASPHAEAPASAAAEVSTAEEAAVAAGIIDRRFVVFHAVCEIHKWRKFLCGARS